MTGGWPLAFEDVLAARRVVAAVLPPTPLRSYALLDEAVGHGVRVLVKHENHQPTNAFKARNGLVALSRLSAEERGRGVVTATRGNHGQGVAWAGQRLGVRSTICVPLGNNPEKNAAIRAFGAELVERGETYDDAVEVARELVARRGMTFIHSTNDLGVLAGAATIALEVFDQEPGVDAFVIAVGGGSQAVGAMTVARELAPETRFYGVQAAAASTIHDSWHAGERVRSGIRPTLADGLATGDVYDGTFGALSEGLTDFITVGEEELAAAIRLLLATTHNLAEGAGAAGLAGLRKLAPRLAGRTVVIYLTGGNIDAASLRLVLAG
ncbi:MAG: pyridoxal-phosphate dependent enzyme [Acidobacteriota bacterium]|nr:pyridoxal-phosphate dependent enzyme [Acidobacteriota bacterium]MDH3525215.1 pyridoxal-phosphate dependent enzyme [Acidobacteriota bacterium]